MLFSMRHKHFTNRYMMPQLKSAATVAYLEMSTARVTVHIALAKAQQIAF